MSRPSEWRSYLGAAAFAGFTAAALGCHPGTGTAAVPVSPPQAATPPVVTQTPPSGRTDEAGAAGGGDTRDDTDTLPTRPEQAPVVTVREIVNGKVPLGRRVRVSGRCLDAGIGRAAGLWTLADSAAQVEVRGLVPKHCPSKLDETLMIFAQVEWKTSSSAERLLLRLPGE